MDATSADSMYKTTVEEFFPQLIKHEYIKTIKIVC